MVGYTPNPGDCENQQDPRHLAVKLAGAYLIIAGIYIILSTLGVGLFFDEKPLILEIELIKGLVFVLITGSLLFWGSRTLFRQLLERSREIERQRQSMLILDQRASAGLMASAIGHDANNLLSSIAMSVEILNTDPPEERRQRLLKTLENATHELMALNRRLVHAGEAEQQGDFRRCCIMDEVKRALRLMDVEHPIGKLDLSIQSEGDSYVPLNRHLFCQIVINLLSNVVRHAGESSQAAISVIEEDGCVAVTVEDNGPGIPEDEIEHIFEPFYSSHNEGCGLGLSSVSAIVRLHGGTLECGKASLGGARFTLRFPKGEPETVPTGYGE